MCIVALPNTKHFWLILKAGLAATLFWCMLTIGEELAEYAEEAGSWAVDTEGRLGMCGPGEFILRGMNSCHPLLTCREIQSHQFHKRRWVAWGAVKNVYKARWKEHDVALSTLIWWKFGYFRDKYRNIPRLYRALGPSPLLSQLVGTCGDWHVTEYHPLGPAYNIHRILARQNLTSARDADMRLGFCVQYVRITHFLHNSPLGTLVMCDSHTLKKTLSQYLVTLNMTLILNDLDDLKVTTRTLGGKVKCHDKEMRGDFIAPEQRWPYKDRPYKHSDMPGYDEKTDIYKIPAICDYFLGEGGITAKIRRDLREINDWCLRDDPRDRPSAQVVLDAYISVANKYSIHGHVY